MSGDASGPTDDVAIGVLCLETTFAKPLGHVRNPATFGFPVRYAVVAGATPERVVTEGDPRLLEPFVAAARDLAAQGVGAITSGCGFLAMFQRELAAAVDVPVYASSLVQVPTVHRMLRPDQAVGLLVAKEETFGARHLAGVGATDVPVRVAGMAGCPEFREVVLEGRREELDLDRFAAEVAAVTDRLLAGVPDLGAIVLECTDLVPFAHLVQARAGVPVFDVVTLTESVHHALTRRPFRTGDGPR